MHGVKPILFSVLVNGDNHRLLIYHKGFRVWGGECEGGKDAQQNWREGGGLIIR